MCGKRCALICMLGRGRTYAFGVYIGHKICHRVLATSATLLSQPDITMSEGPKDQKGRCPASKQVISCLMALKQQVYVFLLSQRQSHVKYRRKLNFAILQRQHVCTARFRLYKRFIWSLWWISTHTNLQICTIHLVILSMGMACCHPLACRFFRKTRCLRPRSRLLTGLLNIASQSSHQQSLQLPQEKQKSPTKGREEFSRVKYWV